MAWLVAAVAEAAGLPPEEVLLDEPFVTYGLTSKEAVFLTGDLADWLERDVSPTALWEHPTISALSRHLAGLLTPPPESPAAPEPEAATKAVDDAGAIAVTAMACRFPGAASPEAYWALLQRGGDAITEVPASRWDVGRFHGAGPGAPGTMNTRWGGFVEGIDAFDPLFFGIAPREAHRMDPQQRLLLEVAWEALERGGHAPRSLQGSRTGVFVGISTQDYSRRQFSDPSLLDAYAGTGNAHSIAANRLSYLLGLRGPSMAVDTACSSSLVAIHLARQSLLAQECDLALAGGVNAILSPELTIAFSQAGMMASDGRCKTFDASADGYVRSEGCGVIVLKRLEDALASGDPILAVLRGSAVNHDGQSNGLTAPSGVAQQDVLRQALRQARLSPASIGYVEAHGTGTKLGDPIEVDAIQAVLSQERDPSRACFVGSAKSNIGHLEAAAGIAGLVKAILALRHGEIPPQVHFRRLNPHITLRHPAFQIPARNEPWSQAPGDRYAGVSAFGFGGTNAHVIVGEPPSRAPVSASPPARTHQLLVLSAQTLPALHALARQYLELLASSSAPSLEAMCFTASTGRDSWPHRLAVVASSREELAARLGAFLQGQRVPGVHQGEARRETPPRVVFLYPGQGAQYAGMAHQLHESAPVFREALERCEALLRPHLDVPLKSLLFPGPGDDEARVHQTRYTQPALFAVAHALTELWASWGVKPDAVLGHSVGEYAAARVAGVLGLEEALGLLALRGQLIQALPLDGAMFALMADEATVRDALKSEPAVAVAAINGPRHVVISGERGAVERVVQALEARGVEGRALQVSHAFHSPLMEPMLDGFEQAASRVAFQAPRLPLISNLTGAPLGAAPTAHDWRRHVREPVQFFQGIQHVARQGAPLFVELGPHDTLLGMAKRCVPDGAAEWLPSLRKQRDAWETLLGTLGALHVRGVPVDWRAFHAGHTEPRVRLPTHPFERQRYWLDAAPSPPSPQAPMTAPATVSRQERFLSELRALLSRLLQMPAERMDAHASFLELGADSVVLMDAARAVEKRFGLKLTMRQLFEELTTLDAMARYLDLTVPADAAPEQAVAPGPSTPPALPPQHAPTAPGGEGLEQVVKLQLQLMAQQLALLGGRATTSAAPLLTGGATASSEVTQATLATQGASAAAPSALAEPGAQAAPRRPDVAPSSSAAHSASVATPLAAAASVAPGHTRSAAPASPFASGSLKGKPDRVLTPTQQRHVDTLVERHTRRTRGSKQEAIQHRSRWSDVRWLMNFRAELKEVCYPIVSTRSRGARFWDPDGNEFIDLSMGFGVQLFGHHPAFLVDALRERLEQGMEVGPQSDLAGRAAELICELTGMKRVTFCNSGTEAVMTALRLARAATGRSKVVMFTGSYHGHSDGTLVVGRMVDGVPQTLPMAAGVTEKVAEDVIVLPYGEERSLEVIRQHLGELAVVVVEPIQSRRPNLQPRAFLQSLREMTRAAGVPLMFDEVITGFRLHPGGAQAWLGIEADLVTYGKVVGGGMPIGVVADRGGFVDRIDGGDWSYGDDSYPAVETTFAAGTFCKHPLTMATMIATLTHLKQEGPLLQERLNQRAARLVERINEVFQQAQAPVEMVHGGSVMRFNAAGNSSYLFQPLEMDLFYCHLRDRGIYIWEGRTCMLSTAHGDAELDAIVHAVADSVSEMQSGGFWSRPQPGPGLTAPSLSGSEAKARSLPLTEAQRHLWVLARANEGGSIAYNLSMTLRLEGALREETLRRALKHIVDRHDALRTYVDLHGEQQHILPTCDVALPVLDLSALSPAPRSESLSQWYAKESATAFDLHRGPLFRANLLKLDAHEHLLVLTTHHVVVDGWSLGVVLHEVAAAYSAFVDGGAPALPPVTQFSDYVRWLRAEESTDAMAAHERYWLEQHVERLPAIELPVDLSRPATRRFRGARESVRLDATFSQGLRELAQRQKATPFMLLLSAYTLFLHRMTGQEDVLVGIPTAGRGMDGGEGLVGYCSHLLPIASHTRGEESFPEYLQSLKQVLLSAYEHQDYPFSRLLERLDLPRSTSHTPLIGVTFNLERPLTVRGMGGLKASFHPQPVAFAAFDLSLNVLDVEDGLVLDFDYNTDLFEPASVARFARGFRALLQGLASQPQRPVHQLPVLTEEEKHQVLVTWNERNRVAYPREHRVHQLVERQVALRPSQVAVEFEGHHLTYAVLNACANQLGHHLRSLGVGPGVLVGVLLERTPEMLVALLAILKSGGAFVPLDPAHPSERLRFLIEDSRTSVVVTQARLSERLPALSAKVVRLDSDADTLASQSRENLVNLASATTPAYVIYTSGSTGEPKGVVIGHGAFALHCQDVIPRYRHTEHDRILQFASFSFDASLEQLFPTFMVGATLVLRGSTVWTPEELARHLVEDRLSVVNFPTAYWRQLAQRWDESPPDLTGHCLRLIIVGGDAVLAGVLEQWHRGPLGSVRLLNAYGPTETLITATAHEVPPPAPGQKFPERIPIGLPLSNRAFYVLDRHGAPVPIGVAGELHIGGELLALGYLHRPELTAQRFVRDPFSGAPEARLYKTGDVVRFLPEGALEFLGRTDHQVKVRGFRVELGEIESALSRHPALREVVVTIHQEPQDGGGGSDKRLVAYAVPTAADAVTPADLRRFLLERLPDYMVPAFFVLLGELPLTPGGKLDRQALPAPDPTANATSRPFIAPRTPTESALAEAWMKALRVPRVGIHDDFFELGGDSLLATQVASRLREALQVEVSLERLFKAATLAELAEHVDTLLWASGPRTADATREEGEL
ncbi:non-ribosomal peptide synthetase [Myxococcus stipitatus DSM 14675]|uniref:Non-ribosomal peptide synthetase n=1 Tax=Myxococcus stipitatus (strain DSM 14675 / JCM 12634 / Mx s8) TaxID=1278073 RepID=L7U3R1_MYXSD|nr:hybrid non-ribosomal peptide synthetase/type I polyketide synthase [Myxococcus stipitatus]AGC43406.1 non-ribosomal peptide synthetase [Myxococcus stipitatus DSM 14675]